MLFSGFFEKTKNAGKKLLESMKIISENSHDIGKAESQIVHNKKELAVCQLDIVNQNPKDYYIAY